MEKSPYEIFQSECPELATKFNELVKTQSTMEGLDQKTKQLINIAIQTCQKNPTGVKLHAIMAKKSGSTRKEVIGAVAMNLHLSGLPNVLECLPAAIDGYDTS